MPLEINRINGYVPEQNVDSITNTAKWFPNLCLVQKINRKGAKGEGVNNK